MSVSEQGNTGAEYSGLTEPVSVQDPENHSKVQGAVIQIIYLFMI